MITRRVGSKAQVFRGTAYQTSGGVTRSGIVYHDGKYKFKSRIAAAKRNPALMERARAIRERAAEMRRMGNPPRGIIHL
jgi:hypothetical protein